MLNTACPSCGDANTQPSHAIFNAGTATVASKTTGAGVAIGAGDGLTPMIGSGSTTGTHQTNLAAMCAPPPKRGLGQAWAWVIVGYIALCAGSGGALLIAFPIFVLVLICMGVAESKHRAYNQAVLPKLEAAWRRRWTCLRCHHQFDPASPSATTDPQSQPSGASMSIPSDEQTMPKGASAPPMAQQPTTAAPTAKAPWHDSTGLVIVLLVLFWPVGLWGLCASRRIPKGVKWALGACLIFFVFAIAAGAKAKPKNQPRTDSAAAPIAVAPAAAVLGIGASKDQILKGLPAFETQPAQGGETWGGKYKDAVIGFHGPTDDVTKAILAYHAVNADDVKAYGADMQLAFLRNTTGGSWTEEERKMWFMAVVMKAQAEMKKVDVVKTQGVHDIRFTILPNLQLYTLSVSRAEGK